MAIPGLGGDPTAGPVSLMIDGDTLSFTPPGAARSVTVALSNGRLVGEVDMGRRSHPIGFSKC